MAAVPLIPKILYVRFPAMFASMEPDVLAEPDVITTPSHLLDVLFLQSTVVPEITPVKILFTFYFITSSRLPALIGKERINIAITKSFCMRHLLKDQ
jgi:hypothetical protein